MYVLVFCLNAFSTQSHAQSIYSQQQLTLAVTLSTGLTASTIVLLKTSVCLLVAQQGELEPMCSKQHSHQPDEDEHGVVRHIQLSHATITVHMTAFNAAHAVATPHI